VYDFSRSIQGPNDADEWEACLTHHYLRSDGPFGDDPITFIDATPAELRDAAGRDDWSEETMRRKSSAGLPSQSIETSEQSQSFLRQLN
jgi:hypothetical protein